MADKIVQLADKDGNNLYPVVGTDIPKITMTDTDPGEGSQLATNHYVAVYGGSPIIMDYSTNEVNTGAKWIDGSDIYKKTVDFGALPNNTTKSVAHNISNLGEFVDIHGILVNSTSTSIWAMPYSSVTSVTSNDTNIVVATNDNLTPYNAYVTVYYTKSS